MVKVSWRGVYLKRRFRVTWASSTPLLSSKMSRMPTREEDSSRMSAMVSIRPSLTASLTFSVIRSLPTW